MIKNVGPELAKLLSLREINSTLFNFYFHCKIEVIVAVKALADFSFVHSKDLISMTAFKLFIVYGLIVFTDKLFHIFTQRFVKKLHLNEGPAFCHALFLVFQYEFINFSKECKNDR
ncbi:hypothetical protein BpHYR1_053258 [Brachionus plicatilis]|uniref:Uncharacterized protein n=1 Tax=Brachionus plicatilis TaxID=10195 RepID=A0A3M7T134_BRAPC|nr:hypothetical protein BpHYR1_053258 [Brachionus plicatilis]